MKNEHCILSAATSGAVAALTGSALYYILNIFTVQKREREKNGLTTCLDLIQIKTSLCILLHKYHDRFERHIQHAHINIFRMEFDSFTLTASFWTCTSLFSVLIYFHLEIQGFSGEHFIEIKFGHTTISVTMSILVHLLRRESHFVHF